MMDPFVCDTKSVDEHMKEKLIALKCNDECKYKPERGGIKLSYRIRLSTTTKQLYSKMLSEMVIILLYFPSTYLVECGFSAVHKISTKERSKI